MRKYMITKISTKGRIPPIGEVKKSPGPCANAGEISIGAPCLLGSPQRSQGDPRLAPEIGADYSGGNRNCNAAARPLFEGWIAVGQRPSLQPSFPGRRRQPSESERLGVGGGIDRSTASWRA